MFKLQAKAKLTEMHLTAKLKEIAGMNPPPIIREVMERAARKSFKEAQVKQAWQDVTSLPPMALNSAIEIADGLFARSNASEVRVLDGKGAVVYYTNRDAAHLPAILPRDTVLMSNRAFSERGLTSL